MTEPVAVGSVVQRMMRALGAPEGIEPQAPIDDLSELRTRAWLGLCPEKFHEAELATVRQPPEVVAKLIAWATTTVGGNLFLLGPLGRGKSFAASACARERFERGQSVAWVSVVEMLDRLRVGGDREWTHYLRPDVLLLDDLGGEKPSDWTQEKLYAIVNRRWLDGRPIIATTNLEPDVLKEVVGARTVDRLKDGALVLRLGGEESRRRPA